MTKKITKRISVKEPLEETKGFEIHDYIREGRQYDISPRKLSCFLRVLMVKINELVDEVNKLKRK